MDVITLALSKKYTDNSISGISGSLAGKNCVVNSITHDDTNKKNVVEFGWTADDGSSKTAQMDVPDGLTITALSVDSNNHLIATLSDGSTVDSGKMPSTEVAISAESGNALTEKADGLYVSTTGVEISKATDNAIETKADGLYVKKTSDVEISKTTGNTIETKADGLFVPATDISGKVDKVSGKGLSTEDYTTAEKTKLAGIDTTKYVEKETGKGLSTNDYDDTEKAEVAKIAGKIDRAQGTVNAGKILVVGSNGNVTLDRRDVVSAWETTPVDTNVPSEKLVKDSLDSKLDSDDYKLTDLIDDTTSATDKVYSSSKVESLLTGIGTIFRANWTKTEPSTVDEDLTEELILEKGNYILVAQIPSVNVVDGVRLYAIYNKTDSAYESFIMSKDSYPTGLAVISINSTKKYVIKDGGGALSTGYDAQYINRGYLKAIKLNA